MSQIDVFGRPVVVSASGRINLSGSVGYKEIDRFQALGRELVIGFADGRFPQVFLSRDGGSELIPIHPEDVGRELVSRLVELKKAGG